MSAVLRFHPIRQLMPSGDANNPILQDVISGGTIWRKSTELNQSNCRCCHSLADLFAAIGLI